MPDVLLFVEDDAQEVFIRRLVECLAQKDGIRLTITVCAAGGYGRVLRQLQNFVKHWKMGRALLPDGIVVAVDANCRGSTQRRDQMDDKAGELKDRIVHAIPDPHIERWFLLDGNAFKKVLGRGCQAPDDKCEKEPLQKTAGPGSRGFRRSTLAGRCGVRPGSCRYD